MIAPIEAVAGSSPLTPLGDFLDPGHIPVTGSVSASEEGAGTPTTRALAFTPARFEMGSSAAQVVEQDEKMKELEKKVEERDKKMEEMEKVMKEEYKKMQQDANDREKKLEEKFEQENAMLKQKLKDLNDAMEKMNEVNVRRSEQDAASTAAAGPRLDAADPPMALPPYILAPSPHDLDDVWVKGKLAPSRPLMPAAGAAGYSSGATGQSHDAGKSDDDLKPMHPKDMKPPPEYGGSRKDFLAWHESFTSMLRARSTRWTKVVNWIKARREK